MRLATNCVLAIVAALTAPVPAARAAGDATSGAQDYRPCAACHSLHRGVHLSGPSLDGLWGKPAASAPGFSRYTDALKSAGLVWNAETLDAWLDRPEALVPGTTMTFRGIEEPDKRANLIAFLRVAMAPGGGAAAMASGLLSARLAAGRVPPVLRAIEASRRVTGIRHCGDGYRLTTADGKERPIWETNLRIKIDTSARGPVAGQPVLLASGQGGDRFTVVFSSVAEITRFIVRTC